MVYQFTTLALGTELIAAPLTSLEMLMLRNMLRWPGGQDIEPIR
jgi:hypothetical protein